MIEALPEPLLSGVKQSKLWREEGERGGLPVTNSLFVHLPEIPYEDVIFGARVGYIEGFNISHLFGLGDPVV
jgi:hypothetical protein